MKENKELISVIKMLEDMSLDGVDEINTITDFELDCLLDMAMIKGAKTIFELGRVLKNPNIINEIDYINNISDFKSEVMMLRESGLICSEISERLKIPHWQVKKYVEVNGIGRADIFTDNIIDLNKSGYNMQEIADKLGITRGKVKRTLAKFGIKVRTIKSISSDEINKVCKLKSEGLSIANICSIMNISKDRYHNICRKLK